MRHITISQIQTGRESHNSKVAVPWSELMTNTGEYFEENDIPRGIKIREPTKMRFEDLRTLHDFWLKRQKEQKPAFKFKKVFSKHQRMEKKMQRKGNAEAAGAITSTVFTVVGSQGQGDDDGSQRFVHSIASTKILT